MPDASHASKALALTDEQLIAIKNKNRANILAKMRDGKPLTRAELEAVGASPDGKLYSILALSQATGHERRKIMAVLEAAKVEPAKVEGTTRLYRLEDLTRALTSARHKMSSERTALECEKLRAQISRIEFQSKRERGLYWASDDVRRKMISNIQKAKQTLLAMPDELAPAVAGLTVPEIHKRLVEGIDATIAALQAGWIESEDGAEEAIAEHEPE